MRRAMTVTLLLCAFVSTGSGLAWAQLIAGDSLPDQYKTLAELMNRADAVVVASHVVEQPRSMNLPAIASARAEKGHRATPGSARSTLQVYTVHVNEVIKGPLDLPRDGISVGFAEQHGPKGPNDRFFSSFDSGEFVLFLVWDKRAQTYVVLYDSIGVYDVSQGLVTTSGKTALAQKQAGKSRADFIGELRANTKTWPTGATPK